MRYRPQAACLPLTLVVAVCGSVARDAPPTADEILKATEVQGGLVVHLGCGDGELTASLRFGDQFQVHGLDRDAKNVAAARKHIQSLGKYGDVSVDRLTSNRLPYIDNLINLIVAEDLGDVPLTELTRVLVPNGVAYVKQGDNWNKIVKPRLDNIDEWTHFLHDASGNAVAHDEVVGPPRHLQWLGSPRWSRHHDRMASMSALVSTKGRIFYIMDEGSRVSIQLAPKWTLVARDAFNGTVLWKKPIPKWHSHLWPLKSGPTQLARRLVAVGDTVYVTLAIDAPVTAVDAATGKTIRTYEESAATEEIIVNNGTLFLLVNKGLSELSKYDPQLNLGDQRRVSQEFLWNKKPRHVMAVDADSGEVLWKHESIVAPLTLASKDDRVFYHDGEKVICRSAKSGEQLWATERVGRRPSITFNFGPRLVVYKDVVLFAGGDRTMRALSVETGKEIWSAPHARGGYQSPEDLLVAGGLVWCAPTTSSRDSGVFTGRDPHTGKVKREFPPDVKTYWFHHRCHIAKATDRFLLPSRTGIEFVDPETKHWDINHWVRGGCLYGIMPCNGLVYAPPHNCACYPEAKLYGLNVLAPKTASRSVPDKIADAERMEKGPAFPYVAPPGDPAIDDWPTFRHDRSRSGTTDVAVAADVKETWSAELGGKLSAPTIAAGKVYVTQIDVHTLHALDEASGKSLWTFTAGGRVDSPPTFDRGRLYFGSADGWVYCVRAEDGELIWRFRAAPRDERLTAFEQLESVWPVHGSVLVENDVVFFVAGRSNFLDGGMRFFRLNANDGEKLTETVLDNTDPDSKENLQERIKVLNMPVALPDILSSDGKYVYMRSQQFDPVEGKRVALGPHSATPSEQGSVQKGETAHLFAPMGFLDNTYFHRSYWVYGRSFAGGHGGYYQAGKYAPSGRILVADDKNVYGFGRKPQYYRWTTTIEHQLFSASKTPPEQARESIVADGQKSTRRGSAATMIQFEKTKSLDPTSTPLAVAAWVRASKPGGVVLARGGPAVGYALVLQGGKPRFMVRSSSEQLSTVAAKQSIVGKWVHVAGVLTADKKLQLYVNGKLAASGKAADFIKSDPVQSLEIGADDGGSVGTYTAPHGFSGLIDEVQVYHGSLTADEIAALPKGPVKPKSAKAIVSCSFDNRDAKDASGNNNHGTVSGASPEQGKVGMAMQFVGRASRAAGSFVKHNWAQDVPLIVRAMVKAEKSLFLVGPPDLIDEEETFQELTARNPAVANRLARQEAALLGKEGAILLVVSATDGSKLAEHKLKSLPVWNGLAASRGHLFLSTTDGKVMCFGKR